MNSKLNWDDLRVVLEVGRGGGLSGAARAMRANHSTVFRKLNEVEDRLGVRLFERFRTGYAPTPAGEAMIMFAERFADEIGDLERRLAGQDVRPSGTVRITTTDTLLPLVAPCLARIRREHPEIVLEVVVSNTLLSLNRRDADIAIRPTRQPPPELIGRRIARIAFAVYAAAGYEEPTGLANADRPWVSPDDTLSHTAAAKWMKANVPEHRIVARSNTLVGLLEMVRAGIGVAALPCYLADAAELRRLNPPGAAMETELWLLTHEDLRGVARVRVVLDGFAAMLAQRREALEGSGGHTG